MRVLRVLDWWIRDYAYALHWQVRAVVSRTDASAFQSGTRSPIVVVPGVYETWRFLQPLVVALHRLGHPVHVVADLQWNRQPVADAAGMVDDYIQSHALDDVVVVSHSKGGLIGKYVMALGASAPRIRFMVAVATPFAGSRYARFLSVRSLRAFRPTDETIVALSHQETTNSRIVSVYGMFDPHIPGGSHLVGAKNVELASGGHFRVLADPRLIAEIRLVAEAPA